MTAPRARNDDNAVTLRYQSLLTVTESISSHTNLSELFKELPGQLRPVVDFDAVAVVLHDAALDMMRLDVFEARKSLQQVPLTGEGGPVDASPEGFVWQTQKAMLISPVRQETRFPEYMARLRAENIETLYSIPLTSSGRRLGAITFGSARENAYATEDLEFLRQVAKQVAVAVDNVLNLEAAANERDRKQLLLEIGEIPLELQPKLLRVLQEQEFERLGSSRTVKTDVRLIAATNVDLPRMVAEKKFRNDLFYRLNVFPITIPPLRERTGDVPLLVGYFTQKHALRMNKRIPTVSKETIDTICRYSWPGNVRELENFIERAVILTSGSDLQAPLYELEALAHAPHSDGRAAPASPVSQPATLEAVERAHIKEILQQTRGVIGGKGGAAEVLGLPISTLRNRMKKLGIK